MEILKLKIGQLEHELLSLTSTQPSRPSETFKQYICGIQQQLDDLYILKDEYNEAECAIADSRRKGDIFELNKSYSNRDAVEMRVNQVTSPRRSVTMSPRQPSVPYQATDSDVLKRLVEENIRLKEQTRNYPELKLKIQELEHENEVIKQKYETEIADIKQLVHTMRQQILSMQQKFD